MKRIVMDISNNDFILISGILLAKSHEQYEHAHMLENRGYDDLAFQCEEKAFLISGFFNRFCDAFKTGKEV